MRVFRRGLLDGIIGNESPGHFAAGEERGGARAVGGKSRAERPRELRRRLFAAISLSSRLQAFHSPAMASATTLLPAANRNALLSLPLRSTSSSRHSRSPPPTSPRSPPIPRSPTSFSFSPSADKPTFSIVPTLVPMKLPHHQSPPSTSATPAVTTPRETAISPAGSRPIGTDSCWNDSPRGSSTTSRTAESPFPSSPPTFPSVTPSFPPNQISPSTGVTTCVTWPDSMTHSVRGKPRLSTP